jgi:hypothetical protein
MVPTTSPRPTARAGGRDAAVIAGLAFGGIALLFVVPLVARPSAASQLLAWVATAALLVAALWLPVRRMRSWPAADRRAAAVAIARTAPVAVLLAVVASITGAVVASLAWGPPASSVGSLWRVPLDPAGLPFLLVAAAALTYALRPVTPRGLQAWAARKELPDPAPRWAGSELRRLRTYRTVPAVLGAGIGVGPAAAYNVLVGIHGESMATDGMVLMEASMRWPSDPLTLALVGYLVGLLAAEWTRRRPAADGAHTARLAERTPAHYLTRPARWIPGILAGVTIVAVAVARLAGSDEAWWPAAAALVVVGTVLLAQRWVVRRPQRAAAGPDLQTDDALRSSAAHGLTGASGALLLLTAVGALDLASQATGFGGSTVGGIIGFVLAVVATGGVLGLWLGYGSAHAAGVRLVTDGDGRGARPSEGPSA